MTKIILDKLALIISAAASPFIAVPFFASIIIGRYSPNLNKLLLWDSIFILFSVVIPAIFIYYLTKKGQVSDFHLALRQERTKPFLAALFSTLILLGLFYFSAAPPEILLMVYIVLINGFIFLLITQFWKISLHLASLTGAITLAALMVDNGLAFFFLLTPLVSWARMRRHRHNVWQTTLAALVAAATTFIIIKLS